MNDDSKVSTTFKCQLSLKMLHEKLNKSFVKEIGYGFPNSLSENTPRKIPDTIRGTIHGTLDRQAFFEPAYLLIKKPNDTFEFSYILRGYRSNSDCVNSIFTNSLKHLVAKKEISELSDEVRTYLNKNETIELGF